LSFLLGDICHPRLYQATYGHITKHYYAGDRRIATRVNGEVYYTLPDPTGLSLTLVDESGNDARHILYDAFGGVLTNTITTTVAAALGSLPEADTGLVHLGGGRYYDPALGRPLQPNPIGGPPTVPQALNRYTATSVGQLGVTKAIAGGGGIDLSSPSAWLGLTTNLGLVYAGRKVTAESGRIVLEGSLETVARALRVGEGESAFGGLAITALANRPGWVRGVTRGNIGLVEYLGEGRFSLSRFDQPLDINGIKMVRFKRGVLLGEARALRALTGAGVTAVVDVGIELYGAVTNSGRWGNPYWTSGQKFGQAFFVVASDIALAVGLAYFAVNPYIAIPVAFLWAMGAEPVAFENVFPGLYEKNRDLQPIQANNG
jgi:hypothetical protein